MKSSRSSPLLFLSVMAAFVWNNAVYGQQSLVEAPSNATVVRGNTAILRCLVANRKGAVQWAKNGVMLGYAREIPGFPRYHVIGNESAGEYHLQIVNTTITDEAEYQCQVAPGPGGATGNDPPLVGAAYLSILVPVENVYIEGVTNNSVAYVNSSQPSLTLTCRCVGVKPPATITWLRNDVMLVTSSSGVVAGSGQSSLLRDSWSVLRTQPETVGGATYTCRAGNDVIVGGALPHVDVIVRVMAYSAPLPPVITGYTTGQILTAGQVLSLHCRTQGGAAPPSSVYFFRTPTSLQSDRIQVLNGSVCVQLDSDTLDCSLTLSVQPSDNGAVIGCGAVSSDVTANVLTSSVRLSVHFGPADVSISGPRDVTSGSSIIVRCETGVANPAASVLWFARGHQLTSVATSEMTNTSGVGFIKVSSLTLQVSATDNGILIECRAANSATVVGHEITATLQLNVYFPPSVVILSTGSSSLRANRPFNVTCTSTSSNPPARLSTWKGAVSIGTAASAVTTSAENGGTTSSGRWEVVPMPEDDGKMLTCIARNWNASSLLWSSVNSRTVQLQVYYPPFFQVQQSPLQLRILEHNTTTVNATAVANPHNITYTWKFYPSSPLGGATGNDVIIAADGPLLSLDDVMRADAGRYQCAALNELGASFYDVIVDVLFPAEIVNMTSEVVTVNQSQPVTLECIVRANPINTDRLVTWFKDPETLINGAGADDEDVATLFDAATGVARLVIKSTILADSGVFRCVAFNGLGRPVNATITLNVLVSGTTSPTSAADVRSASNRDVILIAVLTSSLVAVAVLALVVMVTVCVRWRRRKRRSASLWPRNSTKLDQKFAFDRDSSLHGSLPPALPHLIPVEKAGEGGVASRSREDSKSDTDSELSEKPVNNNNTSSGRTFYLTSASYDDTCHCDKYSPAAAEIFHVPIASTQPLESRGYPPGKDLESVVPLWALDPNVQRSRSYTGVQQHNPGAVKWSDAMSEPDPEMLMNYVEQLRDLQRCASTGRRSVPPKERVPMFFQPSPADLPVFRRQPPPHPPPRATVLTSSGSIPTVPAIFHSPPPPPPDLIHGDLRLQPDFNLRPSSRLRQLEINNNKNN